jgi:uncharacterized membrane protein (DUF4010 family)
MHILELSVALGIGLLIGAERERRKLSGGIHRFAGIRTFSVIALLGAVTEIVNHPFLLTTTMLLLGGIVWLSHFKKSHEDSGITTELSLLLTYMIGALAIQNTFLAAGTGVCLAGLLASRDWLHRFVIRILSEKELHDVIIFGAVCLIILPIAPDQFMGPFNAINFRNIASFVVMVMGISALSYIARRVIGQRGGLPLSGFLGGFISSSAVMMTMGKLSKDNTNQTQNAIIGALFSNVATMIQLYIIFAMSMAHLGFVMLYPIVYGAISGLVFALFVWWRKSEMEPKHSAPLSGHAFDLASTLILTVMVTGLSLISAGLHAWYGTQGVWIASAVAGFADAHSNIASLAALQNKGLMTTSEAQMAILIGFSTNAVTKIVFCHFFGSRQYKAYTMTGILIVTAATWLGVFLHPV